jgi:ABC-type cobalamin/Fe3+-siderophores transport system ATPase subunit
MAQAVVQCDNILVSYRKKRVLGPLSLHVHYGDFWGIVGPNGAGKSTLLKTIAGLAPLDEGRITILGEQSSPPSWRNSPASRRRVGVLLQHHEFFPDLPFTVEDVVMFGRIAQKGLGRRTNDLDRREVAESLETFGLTDFRTRLYRELSGGEQRKVQLARLVAQKPEVFLLDEPTAGLDMDWQERLTQLVDVLYRRLGKTVIMVTHDVDRLPSSCNRVLLLSGGSVLTAGAPEDVFRPQILSTLYGCTIEIARRQGRYHAYSLGVKE